MKWKLWIQSLTPQSCDRLLISTGLRLENEELLDLIAFHPRQPQVFIVLWDDFGEIRYLHINRSMRIYRCYLYISYQHLKADASTSVGMTTSSKNMFAVSDVFFAVYVFEDTESIRIRAKSHVKQCLWPLGRPNEQSIHCHCSHLSDEIFDFGFSWLMNVHLSGKSEIFGINLSICQTRTRAPIFIIIKSKWIIRIQQHQLNISRLFIPFFQHLLFDYLSE